jgi:hypothetical protein
VAITLHRPVHFVALPTRRTRTPSRASQLLLGAVISLVAAPWALLWRSDEADQQPDATALASDRLR